MSGFCSLFLPYTDQKWKKGPLVEMYGTTVCLYEKKCEFIQKFHQKRGKTKYDVCPPLPLGRYRPTMKAIWTNSRKKNLKNVK